MLDIRSIKADACPKVSVSLLIETLHKDGPVDREVIQALTYYKLFHYEVFKSFEPKVLSVLGLFYKDENPTDLYSFLLAGIGRENKKRFGEWLTCSGQLILATVLES